MLSNIPLIILIVFGLLDFILFNWAVILLLFAKGDQNMVRKGRNSLIAAFGLLFLILIIFFIFYLAGFFFKQPEQEFPSSAHLEGFPLGPEFIKVGNYYFSGPLALKDGVNESAIYVVLCKKDGEYSIIYINETSSENLLKHEQYNCWFDKCSGSKNLYLGLLRTPSDLYDSERKKEIRFDLKQKVSPPCFEQEEEELETFY